MELVVRPAASLHPVQGKPAPLPEQAETILRRDDELRRLVAHASQEYAFWGGLGILLTALAGLVPIILIGVMIFYAWPASWDWLWALPDWLGAGLVMLLYFGTTIACGFWVMRGAIGMRRETYGAVAWAAIQNAQHREYTAQEARNCASRVRKALRRHDGLDHRRPLKWAFLAAMVLPWPVGAAVHVGVYAWWRRQSRVPLPVYGVAVCEGIDDVHEARTRARRLQSVTRILHKDLRVDHVPRRGRGIVLPYLAYNVAAWLLFSWLPEWAFVDPFAYLMLLHTGHAAIAAAWLGSQLRTGVHSIVEDALAYLHMAAFEQGIEARRQATTRAA